MSATIRRLKTGESALYRQLRLASLRDSPEAFATTLESALARDEASWRKQADEAATGPDRAIFVMLDDGPAGLAALYRDPEKPATGELVQVWVAPAMRGGGAAFALIDAILAWAAAQGFATIRAEVTRDNLRALKFYRRQGFTDQPSLTANKGEDAWILSRTCPAR